MQPGFAQLHSRLALRIHVSFDRFVNRVSLFFNSLFLSFVYSVKKNHFQWIVAERSDIVFVRKETCVFSRVSISLKEN